MPISFACNDVSLLVPRECSNNVVTGYSNIGSSLLLLLKLLHFVMEDEKER